MSNPNQVVLLEQWYDDKRSSQLFMYKDELCVAGVCIHLQTLAWYLMD